MISPTKLCGIQQGSRSNLADVAEHDRPGGAGIGQNRLKQLFDARGNCSTPWARVIDSSTRELEVEPHPLCAAREGRARYWVGESRRTEINPGS